MNSFDEKTIQALCYYVYMLVDPFNNKPFYIGKGRGNRVFDHLNCSLKDVDNENVKYSTIRNIIDRNQKVKHYIVRHGLTERNAFEVEAALIDIMNYQGCELTNEVSGHNSFNRGLMTSEEIKRLYNAEPLMSIESDCVIININKKYKRGNESQSIYDSTKETWSIDARKKDQIKYVLSEFRGIIVEVFEVDHWYEKERGYTSRSAKFGQTKIGYGFNGKVAPDKIRNKYINKSIKHIKKRGAASVIRYNI